MIQRLIILILFVMTIPARSENLPTTRASTQPYVLHLPGIGGEVPPDRTLVQGLAGVSSDIVIYDWTEKDSGIHALQATERNKKQAKLIADDLTKRFRENPKREIYISSHSGGVGIAAWSLEALPDDVKITRWLILAPGLSPKFDLSKALSHVSNNAHVFWSNRDALVLSVGTKTFGTIDGEYADAAGYVGFTRPAIGDAEQYKKLLQYPYDPNWIIYDHGGDHLGMMSHSFSKKILAPILKNLPGRLAEPVQQAENKEQK